MRRFELLAISNRLREVGIKRVRRIGNSMEFEQVRNYVVGDDPRFTNWKATARKNDIMLNAFQEERAQRSEEHTSELQSLMRTSYAVFCLKKKTTHQNILQIIRNQ